MTDIDPFAASDGAADVSEEAVQRLLREAGPRSDPAAPADDLRAVADAARLVWRERYRDRPARRFLHRRLPLLLAAAALLAAIASYRLIPWGRIGRPPATPPVVATVELLDRGSVSWAAPAEAERPLAGGLALTAGATVVTGFDDGSRVALSLTGGGSLRLDAGTRLRLVDAGEVELESGRVYFDSLGREGAALTVATRAARFEEVGTQFEVSRSDATTLTGLRVREGAVRARARSSASSAEPLTVTAGERLVVRADGSVERGAVTADDPSWSWTQEIAPPFEIEGRTVDDYLAWVGRETGWRIELTPRARAATTGVVLHGEGAIAGLTPAASVAPVLLGVGLSHRLEDGRLRVDVQDGEQGL